MAFTKEQKAKILAQYDEWISQSQALYLLTYNHMTMKQIDELRAKAREVGGELHVTKNTLFKLALEKAGYTGLEVLDGSILTAFAFEDAPGLAKVVKEATKKEEVFALKSGFLEKQTVSAAEITALAELPPLPVMRATLLGTLLAPASKLVRTLAEPARQVAAVVKAYSEKEGAPA